MSTITAQSLIDKATLLLFDATHVRWGATELLGWLNDGQRAIAALRHDAYVVTESMALVAGTKQALPTAGHVLVEVTRNMGASGTTPGRAIRPARMDEMNRQYPDWHTAPQAAVVENLLYDTRVPKVFYVFPPSDGTGKVEIMYSAAPSDITAPSVITLDDIFAGALLDFMLYKAYSKDGEVPGAASRAVAHYQAFEAALGGSAQADASTTAKAEA